jgi:hypothetical protein
VAAVPLRAPSLRVDRCKPGVPRAGPATDAAVLSEAFVIATTDVHLKPDTFEALEGRRLGGGRSRRTSEPTSWCVNSLGRASAAGGTGEDRILVACEELNATAVKRAGATSTPVSLAARLLRLDGRKPRLARASPILDGALAHPDHGPVREPVPRNHPPARITAVLHFRQPLAEAVVSGEEGVPSSNLFAEQRSRDLR